MPENQVKKEKSGLAPKPAKKRSGKNKHQATIGNVPYKSLSDNPIRCQCQACRSFVIEIPQDGSLSAIHSCAVSMYIHGVLVPVEMETSARVIKPRVIDTECWINSVDKLGIDQILDSGPTMPGKDRDEVDENE